ncbi:unnamed protein product [Cylicocyclus nassatus]|uniref:Uncharacterized protein n=1 Tax=Cylicocyclus nassatus TaxID=53992 RepID=A0AA36DSV3_CYLNA|nr:unnamed protein product [Cylicocyclus nassatus]
MSSLFSAILALLSATSKGYIDPPNCENYLGYFGLEQWDAIELLKEINDNVHYRCKTEKLADALFINDTAIFELIAGKLLPNIKLENIAKRIYKQECIPFCEFSLLMKSALNKWKVQKITRRKRNLSCSYAKNRRETRHKIGCVFY